MPVPAAATMTSIPFPEVVIAATAATCSGESSGRASSASPEVRFGDDAGAGVDRGERRRRRGVVRAREFGGRVLRVRVAVLEGDHACVGEGAVGECLDRGDGRAGGELFAPAAQHGPAIERRGLFGQPVRTQQRVGRCRVRRSAVIGAWCGAEPIVGDGLGVVAGFEGLVVPSVAQRADVDAVVLGLAGLERRDPRRLGRVQAAGVELVLDLAGVGSRTTRTALAGMPTISAAPLWTGPHATPRRAVSS